MESSQMTNRPRRLIRVTRKVIVKSTTLDQATTSYTYSNQRFRLINSQQQQGHNRLYSQPKYVVYSPYSEQQFVPCMSAPMNSEAISYVYTTAQRSIVRKGAQKTNLAISLRRNSQDSKQELGSPPVLVPQNFLPNEMKLDAVRFDNSSYFSKDQENIAPLSVSVDQISLPRNEAEVEKRAEPSTLLEELRKKQLDESAMTQHPNAPDMEALFGNP